MIAIEITYGGETVTLTADLAQASAVLYVDGESTPYQVASARHRTDAAVLLACRYSWPEVEWPDPIRYGLDEIEATEAWDDMAYRTVRS